MNRLILVVLFLSGLMACRTFTEDLDQCQRSGPCGSDGGANTDAGATDAGATDAGNTDAGPVDGGSDAGVECNPVANTGCPSSMKCAVVKTSIDGGEGSLVPFNFVTCMPAGEGASGDPCVFDVDAGLSGAAVTDSCDVRLTCAGGDGCRKMCNGDGTGCGSASVCVQYFGQPEGGSVAGACVPTCDVVTQVLIGTGATCGANRGCYGSPFSSSAATCARDLGAPHGTSPAVPYLNACAAGVVLIHGSDGGWVCAAACRPAPTWLGNDADAGGVAPYSCASRGAPLAECHYWWEQEDPNQPSTPGTENWGFCSDPASMGEVPRCASLDAGDFGNTGCAPK